MEIHPLIPSSPHIRLLLHPYRSEELEKGSVELKGKRRTR
jgi:hypothetical protein